MGESVAAVGVSVPVWYARGKTTEPANEVFVNYTVHNSPGAMPGVHFRQGGYEFNLPQLPEGFAVPGELTDGEWANLEPGEREAVGEERHVPPHGRNLLDAKDGGCGGLSFSWSARARMRGIPTTVVHTVRIADVRDLLDSLV